MYSFLYGNICTEKGMAAAPLIGNDGYLGKSGTEDIERLKVLL